MHKKAERLKSDHIDKVMQIATKRLNAEVADDALRFVREFYRGVAPDDVLDRDPETLFGMAVSLWKFVHKRPKDRAMIRVYNPDIEEHGWRCDHTVVEIVQADMPFLVDSVSAALRDLDLIAHLIVHPVLKVVRDGKGERSQTAEWASDIENSAPESYIHVQITAQSGEDRLDEIKTRIEKVLADVQAAVADWQDMKGTLKSILDELKENPPKLAKAELVEARAFLRWVHDDHFTLLGYRDYEISGTPKAPKVHINTETGLGILRSPDVLVFDELRHLEGMPPEVRQMVAGPHLLMIAKGDKRSTIHRPVHMDVIGVKKFDTKGKVVGVRLFAGLFTSVAYSHSPRDIPLLRQKVESVIERSGLPPRGHGGKALVNILETFPRDELFQISEDDLLRIAMGIVHLQDRQHTALFVREDDFERFFSCLVFIPRDRYTTNLRRKIQGVLERAFLGRAVDYYTTISDSPLARLHIIVAIAPGTTPEYDIDDIEAEIAEATRSWSDVLAEALTAAKGEEKGQTLYRRYKSAFPAGYRERFAAQTAVADVEHLEEVVETSGLSMNLYRPIEVTDDQLRFKIYHPEHSIPLSDVLPMLENMGLKVMDELPYAVRPANGSQNLVMIHDFGLQTGDGSEVDLGAIRTKFQETFMRIWHGEVENDKFNRLVLAAGLTWREVIVFRAYAKYLRQAAFTFSQSYIVEALVRHPRIVRAIARLFIRRFDIDGRIASQADLEKMEYDILTSLDEVSNADDDRILRRFVNLIRCTLRTNYFQTGPDGKPKDYLSFKFDSKRLDELPLPRPWREIFVYSPRVEGIHLRGGKVARGGLRWSDRREDFRTEILGLVKAQQVKNSVIVPVGSKGGFVVKQPPASGERDDILKEGIACYRTFIRGLLDITDNIKKGQVVQPKDVLCHDSDDPYLVVAADKGTATFSDIANALSKEYEHWLGDAFASGGSVGYDHKGMGITARGAWESVKRHFREMDKNIQAEPFTVIGVGDMGGDVFGNGMLLSEQTKLVAAFNHLHIFVDPDPDLEKSFAERQRLFKEIKGWDHYDTELISKGGGVFMRNAKSIKLTPEIQQLLGVKAPSLTPNDFIRALLKADVELLWFGGIGTYIKSSEETHDDAGDRSNDLVRVDADEVNANVIGEGANLAVTQRGRIEFAKQGGRLNADFIDNSAGVDCSDHEVNIKILLDAVVAAGDMTGKQRDKLLADMTDEVAELVLRDNYLQTQAISLVVGKGPGLLDHQIRLMRRLEREGRLDRAVEFLPDDEELKERLAAKTCLTRPEISVLIPYSKIWLYDELLASGLPDEPFLFEDLVNYFPKPIRKKYKNEVKQHRLSREIVATHVTNLMVNRMGGTFPLQIMDETGMGLADIARGFLIVQDVFGLRDIWKSIEALDNQVPANTQTAMLLTINRLVERATLWFLRNLEPPINIGDNITAYVKGITELADGLETILSPTASIDLADRARPFVDDGVEEALARRVAGLILLAAGCDIVRVAEEFKLKVLEVAKLYFAVGSRFSLGWMRGSVERLAVENHWQKLATTALIDDLYRHQASLTRSVLNISTDIEDIDQAIAAWVEAHPVRVERTDQLIGEMRGGDMLDFSMLAVAGRQLRTLTED